MKYRRFGKLNWKGSALGFGAMRLPLLGKNPGDVDEPEAIRMIRYAIDQGVNYVDTGFFYHEGKSEGIVGRALKDGYRQKVRLVTKMPAQQVQSAADFDRIFNGQLERLQADKLDFYLLHGMSKGPWHKLRDLGVLRWAEEQMAKGRIGGLGFSFHDKFEVFKEIIDAYDNWTLCQIQYNYMDADYQAGTRGLKYAHEKGLAVVVMEPIRGGRLSRPPEQIARLFSSNGRNWSPSEWALRWVWDQPEVSVVLSGMNKMQQVIENVSAASRSGPGTLFASDHETIARARDEWRKLTPVPCTGCAYCMPCPNGVEIPRIFELYNDAHMYSEPRMPRFFYCGFGGLKKEQRADQCIECGECAEKCPQKIPISEWLKKAHEFLSATQ